MTPQQEARRQARRRRRRRSRMISFGILFLLTVSLAALLLSCSAGRKAETSGQTGQSDAPPEETKPDPATGTAGDDPLQDGWTQITPGDRALAEGALVLVNEAHPFDASVPHTVSVYENKTRSYLVKDIYLSVTPETMDALNAWMDAFAAQTGVRDVNIVAGWRSLEDQAALYDNAVANRGQAYADSYIALPGHSEHHTGLAVDLDTYDVEAGTSGGFDGTGAYAWAVEHAWEYGFIQRYPPAKRAITGIDFESWHFRYVGQPHAFVMAAGNLCLEEYVELLRGYPFSGEHLRVTCLGSDYELYFCPQDRVIVPTAGNCTVFGNNVDGFIVVIETPLEPAKNEAP